jgi:Ser/Thr protein kinase RdoA (MazF antagonist)
VSGEYAPEVVTDLQRMVTQALPRWGLSTATTVSVLNLSENATFALSDPASARELVVRVHRVGYSSPEEIRSELAWIEALRRDRVVETATPVAGSDGDLLQTLVSPTGAAARHAVAFARLPGAAPDPAGDAVRWFERLGELTARMHGHARAWVRPAGFRRKRWDLAAMVGPQAVWGPWRAAIGLTPSGAAVIEQALAQVAARLARFGTGSERFGLVHADLHLANLLVHEQQLRIIDFDDCGFSWYLYDFATAASFIEHQSVVPDLLAAWIGGYRRVTALSGQELAEIPSFVILRRILLSAWIASHREVPIAQQMGSAYTEGSVELAQRYLSGQLLADAIRTLGGSLRV